MGDIGLFKPAFQRINETFSELTIAEVRIIKNLKYAFSNQECNYCQITCGILIYF